MYLTDLATVVRTSGLNVVEVAGWQTRGHGGMGTPKGVVCHHTAGPATGEYPSLAVVRDGRPDLAGPLSALGLGRSGTVYVIAAGLSWHAGTGSYPGLDGNWDCIGIEAESTGYNDWTTAQRDAYPRLCAALCRGYDIPSRLVIAHREWAPGRKVDPTGIDMNALRATVSDLLAGHPGEGGGTPLDPPKDWFDMATKEELQALLAPLATAGAQMRPVSVVDLPEVYGWDGERFRHVFTPDRLNGLRATGAMVPAANDTSTTGQFDQAVAATREWGTFVACGCDSATCRLK